MLFGAAIGSIVKSVPLAVILAFFGHYFLDFFPHIEYSIDSVRNKNWKYSGIDIAKVVIDFLLGILLIFLFSKNQPIIYICVFASIIPDGLTILSDIIPNKILSWHDYLHTKKIHYLTKQKKFPVFWRILSQIIAVTASMLLLAI